MCVFGGGVDSLVVPCALEKRVSFETDCPAREAMFSFGHVLLHFAWISIVCASFKGQYIMKKRTRFCGT